LFIETRKNNWCQRERSTGEMQVCSYVSEKGALSVIMLINMHAVPSNCPSQTAGEVGVQIDKAGNIVSLLALEM
jgi:hypothetical protein